MAFILLVIITICLVLWYRNTILWIASLWMILNMISGIGPISLLQIVALVAFPSFFLKNRISDSRSFPAWWVIIPYLLVIYLANIYNERHTPSMLAYMSTNVFWPFLFWQATVKANKEQIRRIILCWLLWFVVLVVYGLFEAATNSNPIVDWMLNSNNKDFMGYFSGISDEIRFGIKRIQSITLWRDSLGANSALLFGFIYFLITYYRSLIKSRRVLLVMRLMLIALPITVLLTGTRACIAMLVICSIPIVLDVRSKNFWLFVTFALVLCIVAFPTLQEIYLSFTDTTSVGGSNVDMRQEQLAAVLMTAQNSPLIGNGFGDWNDYSLYSDYLLGAESVWFQLILKIGFLGMACYIATWVTIIVFIIKKKIPYMLFFVMAYLFGKTLSSLPGAEDSMVCLFIALAYKIKSFHDGQQKKIL